jgi:hypothetical protein
MSWEVRPSLASFFRAPCPDVYALLPASSGGQGRHDTLDGGSSVSVMISRLARQGISGVLGGGFHQRVQKLAGHTISLRIGAAICTLPPGSIFTLCSPVVVSPLSVGPSPPLAPRVPIRLRTICKHFSKSTSIPFPKARCRSSLTIWREIHRAPRKFCKMCSPSDCSCSVRL